MELKPVWYLESRHYQYDMFKPIIDASGWDVYFMYKNDIVDTIKSIKGPKKGKLQSVWDLDGNEVHTKEIGIKYSVAIHDGQDQMSKFNSIQNMCKYKNMIKMPHSLNGMGQDLVTGVQRNKNIGFYLDVWRNIKQMNDYIIKYPHNIPTLTHPTMIDVFKKPNVEMEYDTLGIITTSKSSQTDFINQLTKVFTEKDIKFKTIFIKGHPIIGKYMKVNKWKKLSKFGEVVLLPADSWKYDFTDRCQYLVSGSSSMFIEIALRSNIHNKEQSVYTFDSFLNAKHDGIGKVNQSDIFPDIVNIKDFDKSKKISFHLYDDLLTINKTEDIIKYYLNLIKKTIDKMN